MSWFRLELTFDFAVVTLSVKILSRYDINALDTETAGLPTLPYIRHTFVPGYISETVRCRKLILIIDIGQGCGRAASWFDLDLTFDLAVVTLSLKIL